MFIAPRRGLFPCSRVKVARTPLSPDVIRDEVDSIASLRGYPRIRQRIKPREKSHRSQDAFDGSLHSSQVTTICISPVLPRRPLPSRFQSAPKTFLEKRSIVSALLCFHRVVEFHVVTFQVCAVTAFARMMVWDAAYSLQARKPRRRCVTHRTSPREYSGTFLPHEMMQVRRASKGR